MLQTIKNFFVYGWAMRHQREWDFGYLDQMLLFKLKRMREDFDGDYRSLDIAIRLLQRMCDRQAIFYAVNAEKRFNAKYGAIKMKELDIGSGYSIVSFYYENEDENIDEEKFKLTALSAKIYNRDKRWLWGIFAKYKDGWWT